MITRRAFVASGASVICAPALAQTRRQNNFSRFTVIEAAERLASRGFDADNERQPPQLAALNYDDYRKIRMRPEARIDLGAGFLLDLFHRGHIFPRRIGVNVVRDGASREIQYRPRMFDYGGLRMQALARDTGFAGIRIRYPLNKPGIADELCVFLGASYFRFLSRGQIYGSSARALGINAGLPGVTEEFPFFREFWIEEADKDAHHLVLHALLDSSSLTGAYRFAFLPGDETSVETQAILFPRVAIERPAIAPITSMFLTGAQDSRVRDHFRTEVHDSDGLKLEADGERKWRPLKNPAQAEVSGLPVSDLRSFGLLQRHRAFDDYQDLEASYEKRPGYIVEPMNDWGSGDVMLSELSTELEINDNIVASFRPAKPLLPDTRYQFDYRIRSVGAEHPSFAIVQRTSISRFGDAELCMIDFTGGDLAYWKDALADVSLTIVTKEPNVRALGLSWNPHVPGIRARLLVPANRADDARVEAHLVAHGRVLSETWLHPMARLPVPHQELAQEKDVR